MAQLLNAGLSRRAVEHRVARGSLLRVHRGVYLVGPLEAPFTRAMAAVLAVGDRAVLSHATASAVWNLVSLVDGPVDVSVAGRDVRSRPGIVVHRVAHLPPEDVRRHRSLALTSPARTLRDLATILTRADLTRAVEEAERRGLVSHADLTTCRSQRGAAALRSALAHDARQLTRSEAERRFLDLMARAGLPTPAANTRVGGYEVDFVWHAQRLIVEIDGYAFHSSRAAFERDRVRDTALQMRGYRVIRVTWRRLVDEPEAVAAAVATALAMAA